MSHDHRNQTKRIHKHGFNNTITEHWNVYVDLVGRGVTINFDQDEAEANVLIRKLLKSCND